MREAAGEVCRRAETGAQSVRSLSALPVERPDTSYEDAQLAALLASIADEVQARTASLCATIAADFAGRIELARRMLSRDQVAAAVAALKQAKREAVRFARESARAENRIRQARTRVQYRL